MKLKYERYEFNYAGLYWDFTYYDREPALVWFVEPFSPKGLYQWYFYYNTSYRYSYCHISLYAERVWHKI